MRIVIVLAVMAIFFALGGCARKTQVAYVEPLPMPAQSYPSETDSTAVRARELGSARSESQPSAKPNAPSRPPLIPDRRLSNSGSESPLRESPSLPPDIPWNTRVLSNNIETETVKFKRIQAKAERVGVEHLTRADIEGLSYDQIRQLRGY
jgi:hypothetical protein